MNEKFPISVIVITLNEEANIERCLRSVSWADEIIIVDSFSEDTTLAIAGRFTDKIFQRRFTDYGEQKNYALSKATHSWVLSIDADEVVPEELAAEIRETIGTGTAAAGYCIKRQSFIFGTRFRFAGMQDDKPLRLFRKENGAFVQPIHEFVEIKGTRGMLKNVLHHYSSATLSAYFRKMDHYTDMEAEFLRKKGYRLKFIDFFLKPLYMFGYLYFFRMGFRDGYEGFIYCIFASWYVFMKYSKYRELR